MTNPLAHINSGAPFHLLRSMLFHFSPHVQRDSVSRNYLGLCAYLDARTNVSLARDSRIVFEDNGFLTLGTERSAFRGWARAPSLHIRAGGILIVRGQNQIGRGSLVWILEGGRIELRGDRSFTAGNNMLIAKERVTIGKRCSIAWGVTICDHDFHKTYDTIGASRPETAPITIEDNVWIGMNATILKGVTVGSGSVVAAGAMVTRNVAPGTTVAGNPARVIRAEVDCRG
jgi:acetyltransferase-like isoleucine patch superfamily enzyme